MKSVNCICAVTMCAVITGLACTYCMCLCLHCSVCADQWMWAVSAIGGLQTARLLSKQRLALAVHPARSVPDCVYSAVCVQSPIGMGHGDGTDLTCKVVVFFFSYLFFSLRSPV